MRNCSQIFLAIPSGRPGDYPGIITQETGNIG